MAGRRRKQQLDDSKDKTRCWYLKEETEVRIVWRKCSAIGHGLVTRQTAKRINEFKSKTLLKSETAIL